MQNNARIGRMLGILLVLRSKEWVLAQELADRFGVSLRTIYRDIEAIQKEGIPIHGVPGPDGGYRLETEGPIDPMQFADDDAMRLYLLGAIGSQFPDAMQQRAQAAITKMNETLRPEDSKLLNLIRSRVYFDMTDWYWRDMSTGHLPTLREALAQERVVAISFRRRGESAPERIHIASYGLAWKGGEWYVVGMSDESGAVERFRVSRIDMVEILDSKFHYPTEFDLKEWWVTELEHFGKGNVCVRLVATPDARAELLTLKTKDSSVVEDRNGLTVLTLYVDSWKWLLPLILSYGNSIIVEEPAELRDAVVKSMLEALRQYGTGTANADNRFTSDDSRRRATRGRSGPAEDLIEGINRGIPPKH